jgi:molybdenum cofactor synthesis domain-containing protein
MKIRVAILTISDRSYQGVRKDASGPALEQVAHTKGWQVVTRAILPDESNLLQKELKRLADGGEADLILTTGGTGFGPRDVTPEATLAVIERLAPGLAEAIRAESLRITPHAMLSRAVTGIRRKTLIVNLPGSPTGAVESLQVILPVLPHAIELLNGESGAEANHHVKYTTEDHRE